ncbi:glycosyltransferase WbuB [Cryobacterium suzukii]|uniref:D-inositol 3-phosphate glycosyltransferase n=1 Tax=Cryobacterium suzukii TaxID=1259198 RepID=A0A4R9AL58_9MICO|nr:glycosyltransferase family 4 protein [Cryobacterium suzukii]TFD63143.1 glycosyltransferase WbuB [Cryobacterium suzukii]
MKIVIVSQYYKPEDAKISSTLAAGLAARGHSVRVVTGYPNFPEGHLYPGYRQRLTHREMDGAVDVKRVPIFISHSQNPFGRIANYLSFAFGTLGAGRYVAQADVIYVYASQMTASIAPLVWRRTLRLPFVLHVQDLWPESITESSMVPGKALRRAIDAILVPWLEFTYRSAAATVAIAPTMGRLLCARGVSAERLHTVYNWTNGDELLGVRRPEASPVSPDLAPGLTVTYAGNVGRLQDLANVIRAAHQVEDLRGFRLVIVGTGVAKKELLRLAASLGTTSVEFRDRVDPSEMSAVYAESDFQMVSLKSLEIFRGTIPSKLQTSLAHGVPVIAAVGGDVTELVKDHGLGLTAAPGDVDSIAGAFRAAYSMSFRDRRDMGSRAQRFYEDHMTSAAGVDAIERILVGVVAGNRGGAR